jgi:hypothetical protein
MRRASRGFAFPGTNRMKRQTSIYIGIAIIFVVALIVFTAGKNNGQRMGGMPPAGQAAKAAATVAQTYTLAAVATHKSPSVCWVTIDGGV